MLRPAFKWYFSKPRKWRYEGLDVIIHPGVFHPTGVISTKLLVQFLKQLSLENKTVLELGCGTGTVAVAAAKAGGIVTASDINPAAVVNARENAERNTVAVETVLSDLFEQLEGNTYDVIIINPPYYPRNPQNMTEKAWFCGEEFEYFHQLFNTLSSAMAPQGMVYMILSEDCDLEYIQKLGNQSGFRFEQAWARTVMREHNIIWSIEKVVT